MHPSLLLLLLPAFLAVGSPGAAAEWEPCLVSVSFAVPPLQQWTDATAEAAATTPYQGIAARLHSAYAVGPAPTPEQFAAAVERVKRLAGETRVWPWVFLNRVIARSPTGGHRGAPRVEAEAEKAFAGMDLDGTGGALEPFYDLWRTALRLARQLDAPGVVFDPEAYSDYSVNSLTRLAAMRQTEVAQVRQQVAAIGARMADIAADEYPEVVILSLFTQFEGRSPVASLAPALFDGLLRRAIERDLPLRLVDGGETVGYCMLNLDHLRRKHDGRAFRVQELVDQYQGRLVLGATLAPWADAGARSSWLTTWADCKNSDLKTILDFEPLFVELLRRYSFVWIYGASAAPYNPLDTAHGAVYNPILERSVAEAARLGPVKAAPFSIPSLERLRPMTDDFAATAPGWRITGGPEASLETPTEDAKWVRFIVQVDQQGGSEKYPSGWLLLHRDVGGADVSDAVALAFEVRFHQEGLLRVGLRTPDAGQPQWDDIIPRQVGEWQSEVRPVKLLRTTDGRVNAISWYIAESWYPDGQRLVFDLRNIRFLRAPEGGG